MGLHGAAEPGHFTRIRGTKPRRPPDAGTDPAIGWWVENARCGRCGRRIARWKRQRSPVRPASCGASRAYPWLLKSSEDWGRSTGALPRTTVGAFLRSVKGVAVAERPVGARRANSPQLLAGLIVTRRASGWSLPRTRAESAGSIPCVYCRTCLPPRKRLSLNTLDWPLLPTIPRLIVRPTRRFRATEPRPGKRLATVGLDPTPVFSGPRFFRFFRFF